MHGIDHVIPGAIVVEVSSDSRPLCAVVASQLASDIETARVTVCCAYLDGTPARLTSRVWWTMRDGSVSVLSCPGEPHDGARSV